MENAALTTIHSIVFRTDYTPYRKLPNESDSIDIVPDYERPNLFFNISNS
jgi:hypothetical protein